MTKIKYVQLEADAFLTDIEFAMMDAQQRGVYVTVLLYLYSNGGKCELDIEALKKISNCEDFENIWEKIKKKFQIKNNIIKHKRVTKELRKARRFSQLQRKKGLASAKARRENTSRGSTTVRPRLNQEKEIEGKEIEIEDKAITNSRESSYSSSNSFRVKELHFNTALENLIKPITISDSTTGFSGGFWITRRWHMMRKNQRPLLWRS
ncbi:MAG: hypothetical protein ACYTBV_05070 [Planctomycetota bacterium]|jgi:uncharacterized protein YdaU (DUF1376 family)